MIKERPIQVVTGPHPAASVSTRPCRGLLALSAAALLAALSALFARFLAFEPILKAAAQVLSADGAVSVANRAAFAHFLLGFAGVMAITGMILIALSIPRWRRAIAAAVSWDALRLQGLAVPNPYLVLVCSSTLGLIVVGMWLMRAQLGATIAHVFVKEGPLEDLTFVLDLASALLCAAAAVRWKLRDPKSLRAVPALYALCALVLFLVAMEEINWGQTLLGFETPRFWAKTNYQHETSLHNLVHRTMLTATWKVVAVVFGTGVLILIALSRRAPRSIVGAIAPHSSLAVLALIAAYSGARLHPELIEFLLSVFFAFYSYRIYVAARSSALDKGLPAAANFSEGACSGDPASFGESERRASSISSVTWCAIRFAVAAMLIGILLRGVDWTQTLHEVSQLSLWTFAGLLAAIALGLIVSAWKWSCALRMYELRYPFPFLLRTLCIGFFLNSFLPTAIGGDAYRVYRTLPRDGYRSRALSAVVLERTMGFLVLLALGGVGALLLAARFEAARVYCVVLLVVVAAGAVGVFALEHGWLQNLGSRWRDVPALSAIYHSIGLLKNRRGDWFVLLGGSLVFQTISIGVVFALFMALSSHATLAQCALITAAVGFVAVLPISINGIGVMEGTLVAVSVALGLDYEKALIVALVRRLLAICLASLCGVFYLTELSKRIDLRLRKASSARGWK